MSGHAAARLTTAETVARYLAAQWTERDGRTQRLIPAVVGIFGHGNVAGTGHALARLGSRLPYVQAKNEQAAVHMAIGYAKANGRRATLACTASVGPGATNLVTGAATATVNRLPVLLLPGDTFASRRSGTVLQQLSPTGSADLSVNESLRPVSVHFDRVTRPEQLLDALPQAMAALVDPASTGAVTIALPQDVQGEAWDVPRAFLEPRTWQITRRPPATEQLRAAAEVLGRASRPLMIAGGGARYAEAEAAVAAFADAFGVPVAETSAGKGVAAGTTFAVGGVGVNGTAVANGLAAAADVVLLVGTRLTDFTTASNSLFQSPDVRFVALNLVAADALRFDAVALIADARLGLEALDATLSGTGWRASASYREEIDRRRIAWRSTVRSDREAHSVTMTHSQAIEALEQTLKPGDVVVAAAGSAPGDLLKLLQPAPGVTVHLEFGFSCMGHEIPAAIGYAFARRHDGMTVAWIGDGTLLMHVGEIVTAVQEGLSVVIVVLVNGGFQSIHGLQRRTTGAGFGNEFRRREPDGLLAGETLEIDYAGMAEAMGATALRARGPSELAAALRTARDTVGPTVVVADVDPSHVPPGSDAWWELGVPEDAADPVLRRIADDMRAGRAQQRNYGIRG